MAFDCQQYLILTPLSSSSLSHLAKLTRKPRCSLLWCRTQISMDMDLSTSFPHPKHHKHPKPVTFLYFLKSFWTNWEGCPAVFIDLHYISNQLLFYFSWCMCVCCREWVRLGKDPLVLTAEPNCEWRPMFDPNSGHSGWRREQDYPDDSSQVATVAFLSSLAADWLCSLLMIKHWELCCVC